MAQFKDAWVEHQRRRWLRPDWQRWLRPDYERYLRPDWERYLRPEPYDRKYSPDQPRVPAGKPGGGQWTSDGSSPDARPRLYIAAGLPRIPRQRPPTSGERTAIAKAMAIWLAEKGISASEIIAKSSWLYYAYPSINSYLDEPKSLEELQRAVSDPQKGYDTHHIVEQTSAEEYGFLRSLIDAPENLVRIPRLKHWEINAWYQTKNEEYGLFSPRDYLRDKKWDERVNVGLRALIKFGVLKP